MALTRDFRETIYDRARHDEGFRQALLEEGTDVEQLRQDIREGLASGTPTLWDPEEIKKDGRARRATRLASESKD